MNRVARRSRFLWLIAAMAVLALACGNDGTADDGPAASEPDAESSPTSDPANGSAETSGDGAPDPDAQEAEVLPAQGGIAAGTWSTTLLGTELRVTTADESTVDFNEPGLVFIASTKKNTPFTEAVGFFRLAGLASATQAVEGASPEELRSGAQDLDAWIEGTGGIEILASSDLEIDGVAVREVTIKLDPAVDTGLPGGCGPTEDDRCYLFAATTGRSIPTLITRTSEMYRIWLFDQGTEMPLVAVGFATDDNESWLDEVATPLVRSVRLGEPAAPPPLEADG